MIIYLIAFSAYDTLTSMSVDYRFCTGRGFIADTTYSIFPAGQYFEPRVESPGLIRREIFSDGQVGGQALASYGEITLINNDGALDDLIDMQVDGRQLYIGIGDDQGSIVDFLTYLYLPMQSVSAEYDRVSIRLRDQRAFLDEPIATERYGGTNVLPDGIDGSANLKDTPKPVIFGKVSNFAPQMVNSSRLIYQITTGSVDEVVNVFDRGLYLARGDVYSNLADMQANAPAAGYFRTLNSDSLFRLGSQPDGQPTCAVVKHAAIDLCTGAGIIDQLIQDFLLAHPDINFQVVSADFTALDALNAGQLGLVVTPDMTYSQAFDQIAGSLGAWWGFDQVGRFRIERLDAPAGTPNGLITDDNIVDISVDQATINGRIAVAWKITLNYDINHVVSGGGDLAGAVPPNRREWLEKPFRQVTVPDAGVQKVNLAAQEIVYDTLYDTVDDATPEAARRLDLLSVPRKIYNVVAKVDSFFANDSVRFVDLGALITLQSARYGLSSGKLCRVISVESDLARNQITFRLWG